jgi:acyl carrier protein
VPCIIISGDSVVAKTALLKERSMTHQLLTDILNSVLQIDKTYQTDTALLGAIAEFDSVAVISVITTLEEQLGISVDDDEISAEIFETFGSLLSFVEQKQG